MDFFEAVEARASVRKLEPVAIPDGDLTRILDAGRRAPSGMNVQPLQYLVIRDRAMIEKLAKVQDFIAQASCVIAIVADPGASKYWLEDAAAAAENMLLAIQALGYASVWVEGTLLKNEDFAKKLLNVPAEKRFIVLLPIGKAPQETPQADRKPLAEVLWREQYGRR
jgi:nitroreductase